MNDTCNNYRIEYGYHLNSMDYWKSFSTCRAQYPVIKELMATIRAYGIEHVWWFYEPYVEITWQPNDKDQQLLFDQLKTILAAHGITDAKCVTPKEALVGDWFANSQLECRWGERRYARCTELVEQFYDELSTVEDGKGIRKQVERCIHAICNPLGLTYRDEAKACFSRGLICLLFCFFPHSKAVWVYRNIFRQIY
jgi:hypothetical protein